MVRFQLGPTRRQCVRQAQYGQHSTQARHWARDRQTAKNERANRPEKDEIYHLFHSLVVIVVYPSTCHLPLGGNWWFEDGIYDPQVS